MMSRSALSLWLALPNFCWQGSYFRNSTQYTRFPPPQEKACILERSFIILVFSKQRSGINTFISFIQSLNRERLSFEHTLKWVFSKRRSVITRLSLFFSQSLNRESLHFENTFMWIFSKRRSGITRLSHFFKA